MIDLSSIDSRTLLHELENREVLVIDVVRTEDGAWIEAQVRADVVEDPEPEPFPRRHFTAEQRAGLTASEVAEGVRWAKHPHGFRAATEDSAECLWCGCFKGHSIHA